MKMYILVRDDVPLGIAMVSVAHASIGCYKKFKDDECMKIWYEFDWFKVVCKVSKEQFDAAKSIPNHVIVTEDKFYNEEIAIAFCPRPEWPEVFSKFKLYN